jgi:hypothetical protein
VLHRGQYDIEVRHYRLAQRQRGNLGGQPLRPAAAVGAAADEDSAGFTNPERYSFFGIGFYSPQDKFEKIAFDDVGDDPFNDVTTRSGWLAMIQHYFFAAWIPPVDEEATFTTQLIKTGTWPRYIARNVSPARQAAPGELLEFSSRLYLGPKLQDNLPDIAPGLEYTVNYGIFTVFSKPLFWLLEKIHDVVGNWGWAIVILTILIKAAFFKLTEAQYRSTARMRKLQPRIEAAQGALRRRPPAHEPGDDGAVQEGEGQPAGRLPADPGADSDFHRPVLGAAGVRRTAPGAVHPVDRQPLGARSLVRAAAAERRVHVRHAAADPDGGHGSAAAAR